jgi:hypothetical protein
MKFLKTLLLGGLCLTTAFADITVDDADIVTFGIFNSKWSWMHDVDRTFSIKNPMWVSRIYNINGANNSFPGAVEMGVALKLGEGYDGPGGYLSILGGYSQAAQSPTIFNSSTNTVNYRQNSNGVDLPTRVVDQDMQPAYNVAAGRTVEGSMMYAFKAGDAKVALRVEGKAVFNETNAEDANNAALTYVSDALKNTTYQNVIGGGYSKANSYKGQFAWGIISGLMEHKSDFTVTYNDGSFNVRATNNTIQYNNTNTDNASSSLVNQTQNVNNYGSLAVVTTAANLTAIGSLPTTFKNYLLNLNLSQRIYNVFGGLDSKLYISANYSQALFDNDANIVSNSTRTTSYNYAGSATNTVDVATVNSYRASYQKWDGDLRLRKRWALNEDGSVTLGIYPQYRPSYTFGSLTRNSVKTTTTLIDTNANGNTVEAGDANTTKQEFGGGDIRDQAIYSGNFRFPVAISWKASSFVSSWFGLEMRYDHTHTWTTLTEANGSINGTDIYKTVTTASGGVAPVAGTTISDESVRKDVTKTYSVTEKLSGQIGFGVTVTPTPATEILLSWSLNPFITDGKNLLNGANLSFIWNL